MSISKEELQSVVLILKKTADEIKELDEESGEIFFNKGINELEEKLRARARVVIDLAEMLYSVTKEKFILRRIKKFCCSATNCIVNNDFMGLCMLLESSGSMEKNDLEKLIDELEKHKN